MSLLSSHYLDDDDDPIMRIKENGRAIGHMHPVTFFWHSITPIADSYRSVIHI